MKEIKSTLDFLALEPKVYEPPTEKQTEIIDLIEVELQYKFQGRTKDDATQFISQHIKEYNDMVREGNVEAMFPWWGDQDIEF